MGADSPHAIAGGPKKGVVPALIVVGVADDLSHIIQADSGSPAPIERTGLIQGHSTGPEHCAPGGIDSPAMTPEALMR